MKKILLPVVVTLCFFCLHAKEISDKSWEQIREIHARAEGGKWDPKKANTGKFLENNILQYVIGKEEECGNLLTRHRYFLIYHWIVIVFFGSMLLLTFIATKNDSQR